MKGKKKKEGKKLEKNVNASQDLKGKKSLEHKTKNPAKLQETMV